LGVIGEHSRTPLLRHLMVYPLHIVRTNIEIDEQLVDRVMQRYGLPTKRAAVELALRRLDIDPMTREEALAMRGTGWTGDLSEIREGYLSTQ
jgi:Arc/MetJ family transcription regulator